MSNAYRARSEFLKRAVAALNSSRVAGHRVHSMEHTNLRVEAHEVRTEGLLDLTGIEVVSWDVDGTLYTMHHLSKAMRGIWIGRLLEGRLLQDIYDLMQLWQFRREMTRVRASGGEIDVAGLRAIQGKDIEAEMRWYGQAIESIGPRAGVVETIDRIAGAGVRQIVVSDYRSDYKLQALGLDCRFERVFSGEELGFLKPSPRIFLAVAQAIGVEPAQILHIGDRLETDGLAAQLAGCSHFILSGNDPVQLGVFRTI